MHAGGRAQALHGKSAARAQTDGAEAQRQRLQKTHSTTLLICRRLRRSSRSVSGRNPYEIRLSAMPVMADSRIGKTYFFAGGLATHGSSNCTLGSLSIFGRKSGILPLTSGSMMNECGTEGATTAVSTGFFSCGT